MQSSTESFQAPWWISCVSYVCPFKKYAGRRFFLVDDENEQVESFSHLDDLIHELRRLGIKRAEIHFSPASTR